MKRSIVYITMLALCLNFSCKKDKKEEVSNDATEVETPAEDNTKKRPTVTDEPAYYKDKKKVTLALDSKSNSGVTGNVVFTQDQGVVTMIAVLSGLTEGEHAIHIHEKADCSSDDGKSSGGHWNPTGQQHGKWGDETGYHKGDIGNFTANDKGHATITKVTNEWCIGCGDDTKDILGKAIIVHQGVDDFKSQPSGAAGSRVSCGGIIE
ncbi:superoxide dismutase family protein [Psychroserpens luteolus]|uniref:superoxide dismutase family protein n=1 Tax=Psychroserpens luteolus TaxID=2855840 RepID=UPI001E61E332|nr:superoxide dismutase family protein [Psychroserpens luteolus]MCD2259866.1 superoxide dismutase family protein [Psychroserpens luteolus]